jgi:hypothetical protein
MLCDVEWEPVCIFYFGLDKGDPYFEFSICCSRWLGILKWMIDVMCILSARLCVVDIGWC